MDGGLIEDMEDTEDIEDIEDMEDAEDSLDLSVRGSIPTSLSFGEGGL